MPLQKNEIIPLTITGVTAEGSGVGRAAAEDGGPGFAVFVPFTAVGDVIDCRLVKLQKNFAYGRIEQLVTPSADRDEARASSCPAFGRCGGCVWRHVSYAAELRYKQQKVADALERIGGVQIPVRPILGCDSPDRYRNKAQYPVAPGPYRPLVGFYAPRSHRIIAQRDCLLQPAEFAGAVAAVERWMKRAKATAYDETTRTGLVRHVYLRQAQASGELMVCLVCTSGKLPQPAELVTLLREAVPGLASVMVNINRADTNVVLGEQTFVLYGSPSITDTLCGLHFSLSPQSFYQVNRTQAERLYALAAEAAGLTGEETLLDLYCGTGTIGLSMADKAGQVIGVETVAAAVEDARRNAADNGIANAQFLCADAGEVKAWLDERAIRPDVAVIDPPRKGCAPEVVEQIAALEPDRVVYVSCDPATLARDIKRFAELGYAPQWAAPVDMFPGTAHVECVVLLLKT